MSSPHSRTAASAGVAPARPALDLSTLDPRRKRAQWRAWHRGTREMDLIMGRFADREIGTISEDELATFEDFLEMKESDVYAWVTGRETPPGGIAGDLVVRLRAAQS